MDVLLGLGLFLVQLSDPVIERPLLTVAQMIDWSMSTVASCIYKCDGYYVCEINSK